MNSDKATIFRAQDVNLTRLRNRLITPAMVRAQESRRTVPSGSPSKFWQKP